MYTSKTKTYVIDLEADEADRWSEVIRAEKAGARRLIREASAGLPSFVPRWAVRLGGAMFKTAYALAGGRYTGEIDAWAEALRVSPGEVTLANCSYELSYFADWIPAVACTAGMRWIDGLGMVHVRSMDWPLAGLGEATRIFRFVRGDHEFVSVGIAGFVGVLSGMVPGAYSVTINMAPPVGVPTFGFGPAFLLREVLEDCPTYDEAVYALRHTELSAPVFFAVCGTRKGQACVIERTWKQATVRKMKDAVLVQANHHVAARFRANNAVYDEEVEEDEYSGLEFSQVRADTLEERLRETSSANTLSEAARCLRAYPVRHEESYQQMVFHPRSGELKVWRLVS
jgi:hypothetical protein